MLVIAALIGTLTGAGCDQKEAVAGDLTVERLPDIQPNLPEVPKLPPPPHPTRYSDGSYSVYGLRHRVRHTMDTEVEVTAHIVGIYEPPECPEGEECPLPAAPHMWVADTPDEADAQKRLTVAGYAENHAQIEEAIKDAARGKKAEVPEGVIPVPTDFAVGAKVKLQGRFTRISGSGFNISEGLLEYRGHQTLTGTEGPAE